MSSQFNRALLLYHQARYQMAEEEARRVLLGDPHDFFMHAVLGLCLMRQDRLPDAQQETQQAIVLAPDEPFPHHAHSIVLVHRKRAAAAEASAREAVRLDPTDPIYRAQLATCLFQQQRWQESLDECLAGLEYDAEHQGCSNLRSMALTKLGRQAESIATVDESLARDPDNEFAHANKGWALLHSGHPRRALEHFREALRLNPNLEYAQHGVVEALKARNFLYRWMLAYFLWMSRLSNRAKWGVILGGYFGMKILRNIGRQNPELELWFAPIFILYLLFVILTWFSVPLFNLLLRLNKFGRYALSRDQRVSSNWFGACLAVALGGIALGLTTSWAPFYWLALYAGLMSLPLVALFHCDEGWPRKAMTAFTVILALVGAATLVGYYVELPIADGLLSASLLGFIATPWLSNYLAMATPEL